MKIYLTGVLQFYPQGDQGNTHANYFTINSRAFIHIVETLGRSHNECIMLDVLFCISNTDP